MRLFKDIKEDMDKHIKDILIDYPPYLIHLVAYPDGKIEKMSNTKVKSLKVKHLIIFSLCNGEIWKEVDWKDIQIWLMAGIKPKGSNYYG